MRVIPSLLLLVLVTSAALARDRDKVTIRTLLLSEHPGQWTHTLHVTGQVVSVLRFDQPVNPARTRMLGWEGRFEPLLVGGNKVILEPLHDLALDERIPLVVTLADGTEVPFLLAPPLLEEKITDQQVNVFKNRESYNAVLSSLYDALQRERVLEEENERLRKEETSEDHALAALLATGASKQTPFIAKRRWVYKEADVDVEVVVFSGKSKAAVVLNIKNQDPEQSWQLTKVRAFSASTGELRTVAVKTNRTSIAPGRSGSLAIVADKSAFMNKSGPGPLALEIFRHDGLRQAYVVLDHRLVRE